MWASQIDSALMLLVWQATFRVWARSSGWIERQTPSKAEFVAEPPKEHPEKAVEPDAAALWCRGPGFKSPRARQASYRI